MRTVRRFDSAKLPAYEITREGFLKAPARISRVGVYEYLDGAGKIRRELRLPDDVFDPESIASFAMLPITDGHPAGGSVTSENARDLQRGHLGENVEIEDDRFLAARVLITDGALVKKVVDGDAAELSCGYTCVVVDESGTHPEFGDFDCRQTVIRGNHVAVVPEGRAGAEVRVRLDEGDAHSVQAREDSGTHTEERTMKIPFGSAQVDVPDTIAALINAERTDAASVLASRDAAIATLTTERDTARTEIAGVTARADSAEARATRLDAWFPNCYGRMCYTGSPCCMACPSKTTCAVICGCNVPGDPPAGGMKLDAKDPEIAAAVSAFERKTLDAARARADLETFATKIGVEVKADAIDLEIRRACAAKLSGLNLDGKGAEYVAALFDLERKRADERPAGAASGPVIERADAKPAGEVPAPTAATKRADMIERESNRWKAPPADGKSVSTK